MEKLSNLLPMQLQYFAEGELGSGEQIDPKDIDTTSESDDPNNQTKGPEDTAKIIEKLQGRIGKEQNKKNELQEQLEKAQAELKKLKTDDPEGDKPEKTPEQLEVEQLKRQIARRDIIDSTLDVFKESNIEMPKPIVSMFVNDDRDKTVENANELLKFITDIKKQTEASVRSEYAGGKVPSATKHKESSSSFGTDTAKSGNTRVPLQGKY